MDGFIIKLVQFGSKLKEEEIEYISNMIDRYDNGEITIPPEIEDIPTAVVVDTELTEEVKKEEEEDSITTQRLPKIFNEFREEKIIEFYICDNFTGNGYMSLNIYPVFDFNEKFHENNEIHKTIQSEKYLELCFILLNFLQTYMTDCNFGVYNNNIKCNSIIFPLVDINSIDTIKKLRGMTIDHHTHRSRIIELYFYSTEITSTFLHKLSLDFNIQIIPLVQYLDNKHKSMDDIRSCFQYKHNNKYKIEEHSNISNNPCGSSTYRINYYKIEVFHKPNDTMEDILERQELTQIESDEN